MSQKRDMGHPGFVVVQPNHDDDAVMNGAPGFFGTRETSAVCRSVKASILRYVYVLEAEAVEEGGYGGAGVFAGGVEDAVGEGGLLELLLGLGAGVGLEVLVDGDEQAGGAGVDAGVLIVEVGDEELRGGQGDVDGACAAGLCDLDVFGFELGEIDAGDGLAVDDEEDAVAGEKVGEDGAGLAALDDGVHGVDDGFETVEALDLLDDGGDRGVEGGGASGDEGGDAGEDAGGGLTKEDAHGGGAKDEREEKGDEGSGGGAAGRVLSSHVCTMLTPAREFMGCDLWLEFIAIHFAGRGVLLRRRRRFRWWASGRGGFGSWRR